MRYFGNEQANMQIGGDFSLKSPGWKKLFGPLHFLFFKIKRKEKEEKQ